MKIDFLSSVVHCILYNHMYIRTLLMPNSMMNLQTSLELAYEALLREMGSSWVALALDACVRERERERERGEERRESKREREREREAQQTIIRPDMKL